MAEAETFIPYAWEKLSSEEQLNRSSSFYEFHNKRRTVRAFSDEAVDLQIMENIIHAAGTAPSGANKQPWVFCLISDQNIKKQIREAAEKEEYLNYHGRMSDSWLEDLKKFGTDWNKPFLETAPYLIAVFKKAYDLEEGDKKTNYYVNESVGLATGYLLAAIHNAGLASLTHTPSPLNFLTKILDRPSNERPFLLIPVGFPSENATVPDIARKSLNEIMVKY